MQEKESEQIRSQMKDMAEELDRLRVEKLRSDVSTEALPQFTAVLEEKLEKREKAVALKTINRKVTWLLWIFVIQLVFTLLLTVMSPALLMY